MGKVLDIMKAMKLLKSKEVPEKLLDFHGHLIMYLIWLGEETGLDVHHEEFLNRATQYMKFLDTLGVEIPLPTKEDAKSDG